MLRPKPARFCGYRCRLQRNTHTQSKSQGIAVIDDQTLKGGKHAGAGCSPILSRIQVAVTFLNTLQ